MNQLSIFLLNLGIILDDTGHNIPNGEEFYNKIFPNVWAFLIQLLSLIVMIIVFIWLGYKPVKKIIKERQDHIEKQITDADDLKSQSEENFKESETTLSDSKRMAIQIVDDAKEDALKEKAKIVNETEEEIRALKKKCADDIKLEKEKAKDDIKREIITVALDASKEVLKRELVEKDNDKLVDDFINGLDGE